MPEHPHNVSSLESILDPEMLPIIFKNAVRARRGCAIAACCKGRWSSAVTGFSEALDVHEPVETGCLAKIMTAIVLLRAVAAGKLGLDDVVADLYGAGLGGGEALPEDLRVHHLLNHTHGMDEAALTPQGATRVFGGPVREQLRSFLSSVGTLAAPGTLFNYGNFGSLVISALLEKRCGVAYSTLLNEFALEGAGAEVDSAAPVCPALGDGLRLSAMQIATIARQFMQLHGSRFRESAAGAHSIELPLQPYMGRRITLGWFEFIEGCFGHSGHGVHDSVLVRCIPEEDVTIAITARNTALAGHVFRSVFGHLFAPQGRKVPAVIGPAGARQHADTSAFEGRFANASISMDIRRRMDTCLEVEVIRARAPGVTGTVRTVQVADGSTLMPEVPEPSLIPMLHFSHPGDGGLYGIVRTGKTVLARES